ncbi:MAG: hypothetical protein O3A91_08905 [Proteobacteria bacterium]|nr:hypothetical protein [Pseudomonadota bacterium]
MPDRRRVAAGLILLLATPASAFACNLLADKGSVPLRPMVARVKYQPETEAWAERMSLANATVHFVLRVNEPRRIAGRCHWSVEAHAENRLWKRFLVPSEDGPVIEQAATSRTSNPDWSGRSCWHSDAAKRAPSMRGLATPPRRTAIRRQATIPPPGISAGFTLMPGGFSP